MRSFFTTFFGILLFSFLCTGLVTYLSKRIGFVSHPDGKRWNSRVVALGGGVAIFLAISVGFFWRGNSVLLSIYPAFFLMFLLGFLDDVWGTTPTTKLIIQVICASFVVSKGFVAPFPWAIPGIALTVIWIVGMTNSLNLIDNMDGLAGGCTTIAALGMALVLMNMSPALPGETFILVSVAGATLGFVLHNFQPARVFMGDAGSLPLGFLLAVLSTRLQLIRTEISPIFSCVLILLILIVPLLDTFLVIIARRSAKRPITSGGRDHTSHRLVALGLSERKAVITLYGLGILGSLAAYFALPSSLTGVLTVVASMLVLCVLFLIFLLEIAVYPAVTGSVTRKAREPFPVHIQNLVEIALDVCAVTACWLAAHLVRFHESGMLYYRDFSVIPFLPYVITSKLVAISFFRLYRGIWRSISPRDIYQIFKATLLGSGILALGLAVFTGFTDISRVVLILDSLFVFLALVATRTGLIAFRRWAMRVASNKGKAAFFGNDVYLPLVENLLKTERGLEFRGVIAPSQSNELLERVKEQEIDVLLTLQDETDKIFESVRASGVSVRRVKAYLA